MHFDVKKLSTTTPFRARVYRALLKVPEGKVTTYRLLGHSIGCRSAQAVGQALKNNPFAPAVPCHRVVKTDRTLGGFAGRTEGPEISRKTRLLKKEGVQIRQGKVEEACLFSF